MRIMIVEDNDALAQTIGWLLEMLGHEYLIAEDGPSAIRQVEAFRPQVMMLDIGLPIMNGYDLCRQLKPRPELAQTVFIALTGYVESEHRARAEEAGFDHHIVKPLHIDQLEALLNGVEAQLSGDALPH